MPRHKGENRVVYVINNAFMKNIILLLIAIMLCDFALAKKPYDIEYAKKIAKENGAPGIVSTYKGQRVYFDPNRKEYLTHASFVYRYGRSVVNKLDSIYIAGIKRHSDINSYNTSGYSRKHRSYKIMFDHKKTITGSSMIGFSVGAYMIGSSIIDSRAKTLKKELAADKITLNEYNNSIESLGKTKRAMGYVCGGISIAGAIVVLTGICRDYADGIDLGHNFTVSDNGAGISLTKKF